ncbi:hypothetical protein [Sphingomonas sp.]|uniref:hypothetical protein n=1 Tax=Sphingomonas sp. TaxID=28214 RepID=UPI002DF4E188|nr:hypothetical protein [Sphingomonas sp.]
MTSGLLGCTWAFGAAVGNQALDTMAAGTGVPARAGAIVTAAVRGASVMLTSPQLEAVIAPMSVGLLGGYILGVVLSTAGYAWDARSLERAGGPSLSRLRREVRAMERVICRAALKPLHRDLHVRTSRIAAELNERHGLPRMPVCWFESASGLRHAAEYLRLIHPHLRPEGLELAKTLASSYVHEIAQVPSVASPPSIREETRQLEQAIG